MRLCVAALLAASLVFSLPFRAHAAKKHPHAAKAAANKAKAQHLARLAAKQKVDWRAHLTKVRALPRAERTALKRHERHIKQAQTKPPPSALPVKQAKSEKRTHAAKVAALNARAQLQSQRAKRQQAKLTRQAAAHNRTLADQAAAHSKKLALVRAAQAARVAKSQAARQAIVAEHQQALARKTAAYQAAQARRRAVVRAQAAAHQARLSQQQAAYAQRLRARQRLLAQAALNHQARIAKQQSAHNARLAAQRAHWVALHGDGSGGRSIKFWQTVAAGVPVKVITVDLNDDNVKVSAVMSLRGNGTSEPFRQMIERANPNVAVTGTFFSLDNLHPVGDIVIDGSLVHFGGMGTALCVTPGNQANMVTVEWGRHRDWSPYDFVVACGPRLLRRRRVVLDPRAERFRDKHMLAPNSRIAVGITNGNKLVFAMTKKPIYLGRLAKVMQSLGTSEAMNLDAGTSTGFYYNGATLARPGRNLTNMIVVYGRKDRYQRALDQLVPSPYRRNDRTARRQFSQLVRP